MSIVAISGYAGSGKDLAAKMIQHHHLTYQLQIDNPIEELIKEDTSWWLDDVSGWEIKKYAGKLKATASMLTGIPIEKFEDQEFKKTKLGQEWDYQLIGEDWVDGKPLLVPMTVRDFLQKLGTDGLRNGLHTNTWVNALMADYVYDMSGYSDRMSILDMDALYPNWIITDCRFPNEAQAVRDRNGLIFRIERPGVTAVNAHPSETALDGYNFDDVIVNDGSIQDLYEKVKFTIEKRNVCYP